MESGHSDRYSTHMRMHRFLATAIALAATSVGASSSFAQAAGTRANGGPEAALHAAYNRLATRLSRYQRAHLAQSEQAWLHFREAQCNFESFVFIGGPLGIAKRAQDEAQSECWARETRLRTEALRADYKMSWDGTN